VSLFAEGVHSSVHSFFIPQNATPSVIWSSLPLCLHFLPLLASNVKVQSFWLLEVSLTHCAMPSSLSLSGASPQYTLSVSLHMASSYSRFSSVVILSIPNYSPDPGDTGALTPSITKGLCVVSLSEGAPMRTRMVSDSSVPWPASWPAPGIRQAFNKCLLNWIDLYYWGGLVCARHTTGWRAIWVRVTRNKADCERLCGTCHHAKQRLLVSGQCVNSKTFCIKNICLAPSEKWVVLAIG
jgi:hypothetical protein